MQLFLSYPRKNKDLAVQLKEVLFKGGHTVWMDDQLITGKLWRQQLEDQIRQADGIVLALTPAWLESPYCQWEFITAAELGKQVFPVLLAKNPDGSMPDIPHGISQYQWADFSAGLDNTDKIQKFLNDLLKVAVTLKAADAAGINKEHYAMAINQQNQNGGDNIQHSGTGDIVQGDKAGGKIDKSIRIGGNIQAGNLNIGGTQTFHGNVSITMGDLTQTIQQMPGTAVDEKAELANLVKQFEEALKSVSPAHSEDAQALADGVTELVDTAADPNAANKVKSKANLLKKAAENLAGVMPIVTGIAVNIIAQILKMGGGQ